LVSYTPTGDRKIANLFNSVQTHCTQFFKILVFEEGQNENFPEIVYRYLLSLVDKGTVVNSHVVVSTAVVGFQLKLIEPVTKYNS
jgi:hypothetical protein